MPSITDPFRPVREGVDAVRRGDGGGFIRSVFDPAGLTAKSGNAAVPAPIQTPEQDAAFKYEQDKKDLSGKLIENAKDFRGQLPGYEQTLYNQIEGQTKSAIAKKQQEIKRQANRRGLLYSGLRQGSQASAAAEIASKGASQKAKVAPELEALAESMDAMAAKTAQANFQGDLALTRQTYDRALSDARARIEQLGQIGETAGVVGGYFGSKNPESDRYEEQKRRYSRGLNPDGSFD